MHYKLQEQMDSKEFADFGTKIKTTATFRHVCYRPWSCNEVVWGLCSGPESVSDDLIA